LTEALPKCLVPVSGVPILERLVRALGRHGTTSGDSLRAPGRDDPRLPRRRSFGGIAIEYLVSPLFATTNNSYSLWRRDS